MAGGVCACQRVNSCWCSGLQSKFLGSCSPHACHNNKAEALSSISIVRKSQQGLLRCLIFCCIAVLTARLRTVQQPDNCTQEFPSC